MKKIFSILLSALAAGALLFTTSCEKANENNATDEVNSIGTFTQAQIIDAVSAMYAAWEENTTIPKTVKIGDKDANISNFLYAECKVLTNLVSGQSGDIKVLTYKDASHPDRDSYDKDEIAVSKGPANGNETEDLNNIASRILSRMASDGSVPNQTLFTRGNESIAFSTNRAIVSIARAIAAYKSDKKFPAAVATEYLSASATLKAFAKELVGYLGVWENTTGNLSADGSRCTDNGKPWENVHFIPIPYSGGAYADGSDQYSEQYRPYRTITVNGVEYDAAECWEIALKGILDLTTKEGSSTVQQERNTFIHTIGNGAKFGEPIPTVDEWAIWGQYPWYEKADEGGACNFSKTNPCNIEFILRTAAWFLARAPQLGKIGNYMNYNAENPASSLVFGDYKGFVSSMRMFLIAIRFYDYLLENNITENVYDAVKNVNFDPDLYGVKMPDVTSATSTLSFGYPGGTQNISITALDNWTATSDAAWLTLEPASGDPKTGTIVATAAANTGAERTATVTVRCGETTLEIPATQSAYVTASIREFAEQYITILDAWEKNTGTIDMYNGNTVENAHYIPDNTTITVNGIQMGFADIMEVSIRSYLMLRGFDGTYTEKNGVGKIPEAQEAYTMNSNIPATHSYKWAEYPFNETPGNGGHLKMGASKETAVSRQVKIDWLDNFAQRNVNFALTSSDRGGWANLSGYEGRLDGYYGCACIMRGLITYAHFFKYMLSNNLSDAKSIAADQIFTSDLFGTDEGYEGKTATIKDFAQKYVTFIDIWKANTATINMYTNFDLTSDTHNEFAQWDVENAHYIPEDTKITIAGTEYNTADVLELALRCFLVVTGKNGYDIKALGAGAFAALEGGSMSSALPETHSQKWPDHPYNETGTLAADGTTTGNGGHLKMGASAATAVSRQVKLDWLDNFAQRNLNFGIQKNGNTFGNMCGYINRLEGYYGAASIKRGLITYAYFFKYMLDNNLEDASTIKADQIFTSDEFGTDEGYTG